MGCKAPSFPFKYLEVPVGANMSLKRYLHLVVERVQNQLSSWKANSMSIGVRLTLVKSVLGSLTLYFFSLFKAPISIINNLEKLRRQFLWAGREINKKINLVNWNCVLGPKDNCRLNIGFLRSLNISLLTKWLLRFKSNRNDM